MTKEKIIKLTEALASADYEIIKFNPRNKDQAEFSYDKIELLICPKSLPPKKD